LQTLQALMEDNACLLAKAGSRTDELPECFRDALGS